MSFRKITTLVLVHSSVPCKNKYMPVVADWTEFGDVQLFQVIEPNIFLLLFSSIQIYSSFM